MNEVHVRVNERGRHQPYRRINGLYALDVGPAFVSPRDAITYATELEATPSVSPKRQSAAELAALPDADFAAFIEDSGIATDSRPLRASPGGRPTGSSDPPVRMCRGGPSSWRAERFVGWSWGPVPIVRRPVRNP